MTYISSFWVTLRVSFWVPQWEKKDLRKIKNWSTQRVTAVIQGLLERVSTAAAFALRTQQSRVRIWLLEKRTKRKKRIIKLTPWQTIKPRAFRRHPIGNPFSSRSTSIRSENGSSDPSFLRNTTRTDNSIRSHRSDSTFTISPKTFPSSDKSTPPESGTISTRRNTRFGRKKSSSPGGPMFLTFFGGEIWKILISTEIKVAPKGDLTFMSLLHTICGFNWEEEVFF